MCIKEISNYKLYTDIFVIKKRIDVSFFDSISIYRFPYYCEVSCYIPLTNSTTLVIIGMSKIKRIGKELLKRVNINFKIKVIKINSYKII